MSLQTISADEFALRLRAVKDEKDKRYAFFLGAGCSISSGIPAAGSLVLNNWLPRLQALSAPHESDLLRWASQKFPNFDPSAPSSSYGAVMERLFFTPEERQREIENLCDGKFPGLGYATLAKLVSMENGQFNVVLTTNFDDLVGDALYWFSDSRAQTINHPSLANFIRPTRTRPQVVKLHGDHRLAPYNTAQETEALKADVEKNVRTLLHDRGLIFMGYGGNDVGIATMLRGLPDDAVPFGVYWVNEAEPDGVLRTWLDERKAVRVDITDFDEFMLIVHNAFDFDRPTPDRFLRAFQEVDRTFERLSARIVSLSTRSPEVSVSTVLKDNPPLTGAGSNSFGQDIDTQTTELARAAGNELRGDDLVAILHCNPSALPQPEILQQLAGRWIDYTLLATAYVEDPTLAMLDLDRITEPDREQKVIARLLEAAVHVDTEYTDAELVQAWQNHGPGEEVRARHILLQFAADASPVQRDQVKQLAERIRLQALNGADFAELARSYSQDPSSAVGGDLGYFGRGRMVPSFEDTAFKLHEGQISPVVETPFGLHVIKVEHRRQLELGNNKERFRQYWVQRGQQVGAEQFVKALIDASQVRVKSSAPQQAREMAKNVGVTLYGSIADSTLATFNGGKMTTRELQRVMTGASLEALKQVAEAPDSAIKQIISREVTKLLLLAEARKRGIQLTPQELHDLREQAREVIMRVVEKSGISQLHAPEGSDGNPLIEQQVRELLQQAVMGERQMAPLGFLGIELRRIYDFSLNQAAVQQVVDMIAQERSLKQEAEQRALDEITQIRASHPR